MYIYMSTVCSAVHIICILQTSTKMSDVPLNYSLLDEFLAEDDILDDVFSEITGILKSSVEAVNDENRALFASAAECCWDIA
jgi:hypothetical protein